MLNASVISVDENGTNCYVEIGSLCVFHDLYSNDAIDPN